MPLGTLSWFQVSSRGAEIITIRHLSVMCLTPPPPLRRVSVWRDDTMYLKQRLRVCFSGLWMHRIAGSTTECSAARGAGMPVGQSLYVEITDCKNKNQIQKAKLMQSQFTKGCRTNYKAAFAQFATSITRVTDQKLRSTAHLVQRRTCSWLSAAHSHSDNPSPPWIDRNFSRINSCISWCGISQLARAATVSFT